MADSPPEKNVFVLTSHYEDIKDYALYDAKGLTCFVIISYLLFVLKIGPNFMINRKPYNLQKTLFIYNFVQILLSCYNAYLNIDIFMDTGFMPRKVPERVPALIAKMSYARYMYWMGKFVELLDTIFFVLRKKQSQLTFLHIYHHASVVFGEFMFFHYAQSMAATFCATINSIVHIVMYFYYLVSSFGPRFEKYLTWKKYITTMQLVQFVCMFLYQLCSILFTTGEHALVGIAYTFYSTILYIRLFGNFYKTSYRKKPEQK